MENLTDKTNRFLAISDGSCSGDGSGYGSGSGYGDGDGSGYGDGDGYGDGSGDGYGDGSCYGDGSGYGSCSGYGSSYVDGYVDGLKSFNGRPVYYIDKLPTLIYDIIGNNARGAVVNRDLTLTPCYIAKVGNFFAHGENLHQAMKDAQTKYSANRPLKERIQDFVVVNPSLDSICSCRYLFDQHHVLTGSCQMGRKSFCQAHGIDIDHDTMSVQQFIDLTRDSYGGEVIKKLESLYKREQA